MNKKITTLIAKLKNPRFFISMGFLISVGMVAYMMALYWVYSINENKYKWLVSLQHSEQVTTTRIEFLLSEHKNKEFIVKVLKSKDKQNVYALDNITKFIATLKIATLKNMLMWLVVAVIFFVLEINTRSPRRAD